MQNITSQKIYSYWDEVRKGRQAPNRFEIEPARIAPFLPETFILELAAKEQSLFRLAGTKICSQFGAELRGQNFHDLWDNHDRETIATLIHIIQEDSAAGVIEFEAETRESLSIMYESCLMPLTHGGKTINRALGTISSNAQPYWLGTTPLVKLSIIDISLIWPDGQPRFMQPETPESSPDVLKVQQEHEQQNDNVISFSQMRGHLQIIEGGKK